MKPIWILLCSAFALTMSLNANATCHGCMDGMQVGVAGAGNGEVNIYASGNSPGGTIRFNGMTYLEKNVASNVTAPGFSAENIVRSAAIQEITGSSNTAGKLQLWGNQGMDYSYEDMMKTYGCTDQRCIRH